MGIGPAMAIGGMALQGVSTMMGAKGEAAGMQYDAQKADRAAKVARIEADQTQTVLTNELNTTISNIRAVRASTGANPDSPTSRAIIDGETKVSEREQRIRRGNSMMQAAQSEDDARFYRSASKKVLRGAAIGAAGGFASGVGNLAMSYSKKGG
jgi:hypothetical protein